MSVSILVVDDEPDVASLFRQRFRREVREGTYVMHFATSGHGGCVLGIGSTSDESFGVSTNPGQSQLVFCSAIKNAIFRIETRDNFEDLLDQLGRKPERGLVEQHEPWTGHQRATKRHHLLFAARGVARNCLSSRFQAREILMIRSISAVTAVRPSRRV